MVFSPLSGDVIFTISFEFLPLLVISQPNQLCHCLIELTLPLWKACSFLATQFTYRFHMQCKGRVSARSGFFHFVFSVVLRGSGHLGRTSICQISNIRNISELVLNLHLLSWSCAFSHIVYLLSASLLSATEKA